MSPHSRILAAAAVLCATTAASQAAVVAYGTGLPAGSLAAFNAAAGNPPVVVDFDSIAPETDISGQTFSGVTFNQLGAPLIVVIAADTATAPGYIGAPNPAANKLPATTGRLILSPGGSLLVPGPDLNEIDNIEIVFDAPVSAVGFDLLSQSADGFSLVQLSAFDSLGAPLFTGIVPISDLGGPGAPGGFDFFGLVSDSANIASLLIQDLDGNAEFPDNNIGIDTLRLSPAQPAAVPLPAAAWMGLPALAAIVVSRLRRRQR